MKRLATDTTPPTPKPRRKKRKRSRREKLTWRRFWSSLGGFARDSGPRVGSVFGVLFVLVGAWNLTQDLSSLRQNDQLHAHGGTASAVVVRVDEQFHSNGKGAGHTEYWPVTRQTVDGDTFEASLKRYQDADRDRYRVGQHVDVVYDPSHHWTVALAGADARALLEGNRTRDVILAGIGAVLAVVCLPIDIRRTIRKRRARARR